MLSGLVLVSDVMQYMMAPVDANFPNPPLNLDSSLFGSDNTRGEGSLDGHGGGLELERFEDWGALDDISALRFGKSDQKVVTHAHAQEKQELENTEIFPQGDTRTDLHHDHLASGPNKPFQRWIRTLQKRAARRRMMLGCDGGEGGDALVLKPTHHRHSSDSSFGFVTAVRSTTGSLTGVSVLTRSRINTVRSSRGPSRTDQSSRASISRTRLSEDSFRPDRQALVDPEVMERSLQRRRILEELISTEESYIGDVRFLMNVYVTILASLPTTPPSLRSSVNRNLTDIVELHEEILGELHRAVPDSEYTQLDLPSRLIQSNPPMRGHSRWRSLDAVPENQDSASWLRDVPGMLAEPQTAAEVAKIFLKKMNRFFVYEEYGAKYELMIKDVAGTHRTMPGWPSYQKGLEVLAASMGSADNHRHHARKSLTIADLLVKPVQRICKYPLLFSELLKHTPVIDCPYSHMEIENSLIRLREATGEINRATDDPRTKSVLEKTWILQDRLAFPNQQLDAASKNRIRSFGHIQLCGALHVCWQTKEGVNGQYMVALLYRGWLCLATAGRIDHVYTIQACISLSNIKVEEVDNGRGLQCHTARHSWKIVFLSDHQLYELIMTACSPKEEMEWRTRLRSSQHAAGGDGQDQPQSESFSFLSLNIRALGTVFRKPGTIARRISIHRATTVGPKSSLYQVILKNTSAVKEAPESSHGSQINRSQSLLTTNSRIPVLAPSRAERARLEALLSDVWTRDVLPFPGVTTRSRSEHLVRVSASSMMRKLSGVSIAGTFTRRSASVASLQLKEKGGVDEEAGRANERATATAAATAVHERQLHGACASPVLSDITDREWCASPSPHAAANPEPPRADVDGNGVGTVRRRAEGTEEAPPQPCTPTSLLLRRDSSGSKSTHSQERVSLQLSDYDEKAAVRESSGAKSGMKNRKSPSPPPLGKESSRSRRLSDKLVRAGVRQRDVVVQGFRSLFR